MQKVTLTYTDDNEDTVEEFPASFISMTMEGEHTGAITPYYGFFKQFLLSLSFDNEVIHRILKAPDGRTDENYN